jgi:CBS domain-containing protein
VSLLTQGDSIRALSHLLRDWRFAKDESEFGRREDPEECFTMPSSYQSRSSKNAAEVVSDDPSGSETGGIIDPTITVAQAMTVAPRTCSTASRVIEAVLIFRDADCGVIPITDAGKPVGILSDRDVALSLAGHETDLARTSVGELMKTDLVTVDLDETLESALELLGRHAVRRLLVIDANGVLQGILSWSDLVPHITERGLGHVISQIVESR